MSRRRRICLGLAVMTGLAAAAPAPAQVRGVPGDSGPKPLALRPVTVPPHEVRTLANGLRVVVIEQREQPMVSLRLLVGAGSALDALPKLGVANLVATLLDQGTARRTAQQIAEAADEIGGPLSVGIGTDVTFASVSILKDRLAAGLDLLSDVVRFPAFHEEDLNRQRGRLRSALRVSAQDPHYLASIVFDRLVYGYHPYGFPSLGTPASIELLTRDDLLRFHDRYYAPGNAMLAVAGDVARPEAFAAVEQAFRGWEPRDAVAQFAMAPPEPERRIVIIDVPDAPQTVIRIGHLGISRRTADADALGLAVRVLGGGGASRLERVLRGQRSAAYRASADTNLYRMMGDVWAESSAPPEAAGEVLRVMLQEFKRLQRQRVDGRDLDGAKASLAGGFALSVETPDDMATEVLTQLFHGRTVQDIDTLVERVSSVTPDEIQRVTGAYLHPDRLSIVVVGRADATIFFLGRAGFQADAVISAARLDLMAADFKAPPPSAENQSPLMFSAKGAMRQDWEDVRRVLDPAVAAAGGIDALRGVKTIRATARTVLQTPSGPMRATTRTYVEYPSRMRVDATLPGGEIVQAYVDGTAWLKDPAGVRDAPRPMSDQFAQGLRRDWIALFLAVADNRVMGRVLPDDTGPGGRRLRVVELWSAELSRVRLGIDADTSLLAWMSYEVAGPAGRVTMRESYEDYRTVKGIRIPYSAVVQRDEVVMLERALTDVQVNVTFPPSFFSKQ